MRNRYIDLLRCAAILRVVFYHTSTWAILTIVFPAMSLMFALGGTLMAASLDAKGLAAVRSRFRRLLPSFWALAAVFVPAMLVTGLALEWRVLLWLLPLSDPPANYWGALVLSPIWYLRDFLWFVLVSPLVLPLFRRFPLPVLIAPYLLLAAMEFTGWLPGPVLAHVGLYFGAWLLGFAYHDGMLQRMSRRLLAVLTLVLAVAGGAWTITHPGHRGYDLNDIPIGNALWSTAFILLVLGLLPQSAGWLARHRLLDRVVTVLNRRALTIYLWHMPAVILVGVFARWWGWSHVTVSGLTIRTVMVVLLTAVAVAAVGWVEDAAARRRPQLLPGGRRRTPPVVPVVPVPRVGATDAGPVTVDR
ncbi:acyltransferase family protein [Solwaraspora sp. WMMB335]|uniref:acyltransferase family protein n=1 Tax=Solwaraspora sp. WMMB335 TaxID=3404118 RepID=UPI003B965578